MKAFVNCSVSVIDSAAYLLTISPPDMWRCYICCLWFIPFCCFLSLPSSVGESYSSTCSNDVCSMFLANVWCVSSPSQLHGNAWNTTGSEYNTSFQLQVTLHCIVWLLLSYHFLLLPPHVVLPFTTGNAWNMTGSEYNASIHLQVTLHCIMWLLLSCHFPLPPLMLFSPSQLEMHGTWQPVSIMHPFICKWHCIAWYGCY